MKILYISGPVLGNATRSNAQAAIKKNIETAKKYASVLANRGMGFFLPHIHHVDLKRKDIEDVQKYYYELDAEFLIRASDALIAIPGWETSYGARHEIEIAKEMGMKIFYPKSPDDIEEIVKWYEENNSTHETNKARNANWNNILKIRDSLSEIKVAA